MMSWTRLSQIPVRILLIAIHDGIATASAILLSFYLSPEAGSPVSGARHLVLIVPGFVALSVVVCYLFKLTTTKWRFVSVPDIFNILRTATVLSLALVAFDYISVAPNVAGAFFFGKKTILLFWCLESFFLGGSRFAYRYFRYTRILRHAKADSSPALLVGQTFDVDIFLRSIENGAVKRLWPVGLISFSRADRGQLIRNVPVLGGIDDIEEIVRDFAERGEPITRVLMAPSAFELGVHPESIVTRFRKLGLAVNRLPSIGQDEIPRLAPIEIENLLLHEREIIDFAPLQSLIKGKAILVTGGGGVVGTEICRRAVALGAAKLLILENSEPALVAVIEKLPTKGTVVEGRIANIRDTDRISGLVNEFAPDIVFHTAALRRDSAHERDWSEIVKTNIFGLVNVVDAAAASGAHALIAVSVAAAAEATSMAKLSAEFVEVLCGALDYDRVRTSAGESGMRSVVVRIGGDILAPSSPLITKFKAQIDSGGPVTIGHSDMVWHFRTAAECADLVISAGTHALHSERTRTGIYVVEPGEPLKVVDVAREMVRLSGHEPGSDDIDIVYTERPPGDPLSERPVAPERSSAVGGGISVIDRIAVPLSLLREQLVELRQALDDNDPVAARTILERAATEPNLHYA